MHFVLNLRIGVPAQIVVMLGLVVQTQTLVERVVAGGGLPGCCPGMFPFELLWVVRIDLVFFRLPALMAWNGA